ncbi:MAG: hypothetical protein KKA79_04995 [Nanoarchaeota archaeon]|nr:hypothetical protein [Nanoarchaeota archaeon]MCG2718441.1 hypothetical protein [Nanoarchaeota archaeon]
MAASGFRQAIQLMEDFGFYDVVLPFLLVFTLIFATLEKTKILGKESRKYNALIALTISLMFVAATNLVEALNEYLPIVGLVLAIFLGLMLILGLFGVQEGKGVQTLGWILAGVVSIIVGFSYVPRIKWFEGIFESIGDYSTVLVTVAILVAILAWVVKAEEKKT